MNSAAVLLSVPLLVAASPQCRRCGGPRRAVDGGALRVAAAAGLLLAVVVALRIHTALRSLPSWSSA